MGDKIRVFELIISDGRGEVRKVIVEVSHNQLRGVRRESEGLGGEI